MAEDSVQRGGTNEADTPAMYTTQEQQVEREWHDLLFGVRRSVRYNMCRVRFFDQLNLFANAFSLLFGSATIYTVLRAFPAGWSVSASAVVTVVSVLNLLFQSTRRAREHNDLAKRFIALEKKMVVVRTPTFHDLAQYKTERLDIETDEPPVLQVLNVLCHNEQARAEGYSVDTFSRVRFYQRLFAHFFDIQPDRLQIGNAPRA